MAFTLTMPEVGETVTEGTIERWLKQPGDKISKYDPIVEINTDKVNVELPCPVSGTILELLVAEGDTVLVGAALAIIEEVAGEVAADITPPRPTEAQAPATAPSRSVPQAAPADERRRATPRVQKLADELGVSLQTVTGTGPGGRIVEDDVRAASRTPAVAPAPTESGPEEEHVPLTSVRRTIARRMTEAAFSAPAAWLAIEADVTGLVRLRSSLKESFRKQHKVDLTYLPFMAHAVARSLTEHPYLNASWGEDKIILRKRINLGIAVAADYGLIVPVVPAADKLGVTALSLAMHDLGERARTNKLRLEDVQGGTFTLDNTGAFGSIMSQPIINHGQSAIITLEAVTKQPRVVGDEVIAVRSVVAICLSFDHRVLDGHQAGYFLQEVKRRLESIGPDTRLD
jgi:2-oxoisovalerate dehydrogenase E2 component (dihydrolipoyl transacylase)